MKLSELGTINELTTTKVPTITSRSAGKIKPEDWEQEYPLNITIETLTENVPPSSDSVSGKIKLTEKIFSAL